MSAISDFRENLGQMIDGTASTFYALLPIPALMKPFAAAYGLATGTEFSGSGVDRSLSEQWNEKLINVTTGRRIGPPTFETVHDLHNNMIKDSEDEMSRGLTRREAQTKVMGLWCSI